jgi:membrane-bound lytic murein transglycosylase F
LINFYIFASAKDTESLINKTSLIKKQDILIILSVNVILFFSLTLFSRYHPDAVSFDLDSIVARGSLIAVTDYNSTNYFIYRGETMGFNYELLQAFTDHLGVDLEIITQNHPDDAIRMLQTGKADLLAIGLTASSPGKKRVRFTEPIYETRQVLIQRKPESWRNMTSDSLENSLARTHPAFAGKTIYVQEGTPHSRGLRSLSKEIGKRLTVKKVQSNSEELIQRVADGEIDYAVCDENVSVNATYYPDIDVSTPVSSPQGITLGIRRTHSGKLLKDLNQWIVKFRKTKTYAILFDKYYENKRSSKIVKSDYYTLSTGKVSPYDELIKIYSDSISCDWRLLASLICQESRFEPYVKSWAGAYGLMQLMPATGRKFGINITSSPGNNIKAGTKYIESLEKIFEPRIPDENERYRFILAAYNAGPGHILDAMKLAEKHGKDPTIWDGNVAELLLKKSDPQYYNDTVVKNGYFRGKESVNFVSEILERYEHYKNIIPSEIPE